MNRCEASLFHFTCGLEALPEFKEIQTRFYPQMWFAIPATRTWNLDSPSRQVTWLWESPISHINKVSDLIQLVFDGCRLQIVQ